MYSSAEEVQETLPLLGQSRHSAPSSASSSPPSSSQQHHHQSASGASSDVGWGGIEAVVALVLAKERVPLVYHPRYNISAFGLEYLHPFDSYKYGRIYEYLLKSGLVTESQFIEPQQATDEMLRLVHTEGYLSRIRWSFYLTFVLEIPCVMCAPNFLVRRQVLVPMLYATGGTVLASQIAVQHGWAINLSGGYHHAWHDSGGGFCVYADITIAIRIVQRRYPHIKRVFIIDLDAHQGNGHERDFLHERDSVFIFDMYQNPNYPMDHEAKKAISANFPLDLHTGDVPYLRILSTKLPQALDSFKPDFIFYNAGTDCLQGDPLGGLSVTKKGMVERDEIVFRNAFARGIPIVMALSGGYQKTNARVIYRSIVNLDQKFGLLTEPLKFKDLVKQADQDEVEEVGVAADMEEEEADGVNREGSEEGVGEVEIADDVEEEEELRQAKKEKGKRVV